MKRVANLFTDIIRTGNLLRATKRATAGKRGKKDVAEFIFNMENEICQLQLELMRGDFKPRPYRMFSVFEPKKRVICCSDIRDRVVHHSICHVLEPIFERRLIFDTYACRTGKGTHRAVRKVLNLSQIHPYFLKSDISKFFASIDHDSLKRLLRRIIKDHRALSLLDVIVDHAVPGNPAGKGLPIGNLTSQHFANLYLGELDLFVKNVLCVKGYVRYMDDFIVFGASKEELRANLISIESFVSQTLQLQLNKRVEVIAPVCRGIPFLGFNIYPNLVRIKRENLVRLRRKIKRNDHLFREGLIDEKTMTSSCRSMMAHISHANTMSIRRKEFA